MVAYFEQAVGVGVVRGMLYYNWYEAYCKSLGFPHLPDSCGPGLRETLREICFVICSMTVKLILIHAFHVVKLRNVDCRAVSCPVSLLGLSRVTVYSYFLG